MAGPLLHRDRDATLNHPVGGRDAALPRAAQPCTKHHPARIACQRRVPASRSTPPSRSRTDQDNRRRDRSRRRGRCNGRPAGGADAAYSPHDSHSATRGGEGHATIAPGGDDTAVARTRPDVAAETERRRSRAERTSARATSAERRAGERHATSRTAGHDRPDGAGRLGRSSRR